MEIELSKIDLPERDLRASVDQDALDELANSLQSRGQKQAIAVFLKPDGRYEVIYGARRLRAARILSWATIRCELQDEPDEGNRAADKLIENVQREALTPIEEAYGLEALPGFASGDIRALQRQTGKSRAWVKDRLELLELPDDCQQAIQSGLVSKGVGKALGRIENIDVRRQYLRYAAENGLTTESAEAWASQAEFAEAGVLAMQDHERRQQLADASPQIVEQRYNCYGCRESKPAAKVNYFILCSVCADEALQLRPSFVPPVPPPLLDTAVTLEPTSTESRS